MYDGGVMNKKYYAIIRYPILDPKTIHGPKYK